MMRTSTRIQQFHERIYQLLPIFLSCLAGLQALIPGDVVMGANATRVWSWVHSHHKADQSIWDSGNILGGENNQQRHAWNEGKNHFFLVKGYSSLTSALGLKGSRPPGGYVSDILWFPCSPPVYRFQKEGRDGPEQEEYGTLPILLNCKRWPHVLSFPLLSSNGYPCRAQLYSCHNWKSQWDNSQWQWLWRTLWLKYVLWSKGYGAPSNHTKMSID